MGLRISEGIDLARHAALGGQRLNIERIVSLEALGMVKRQDGRLSTTNAGRLLLNQVIAKLAG